MPEIRNSLTFGTNYYKYQPEVAMYFFKWLDDNGVILLTCRYPGGKVWWAWIATHPDAPILIDRGAGLTKREALDDLLARIKGRQATPSLAIPDNLTLDPP